MKSQIYITKEDMVLTQIMKCSITKNNESCLQVLMHRRNYTYESAPVSLYPWRKGFMAKQKEEIWIGSQLNMRRGVCNGI